MGEISRGPPGLKRGRRRSVENGAASGLSQSVNDAIDNHGAQRPQQKIIPPDTPLAVLRAENALLARSRRRMRQILAELGGRALLEAAIECAGRRGDLATLDAIASEWLKRGRRDLLVATGGTEFVTEFAIDVAPGSPRR